MAFSRQKYERTLKRKFMKNPGKANRAHRKEVLNVTRGERVSSVKVVPDRRRRKNEKRIRRELTDSFSD